MDGDGKVKVESASIELRLSLGLFRDSVYGVAEQNGLSVRRVYKGESGFVFAVPLEVVVIDGFYISAESEDLLKASRLLESLDRFEAKSVTVQLAVRFVEDEFEFSLMPELLQFCASNNARLWTYVYPKGDYRVTSGE